MKFGVQPFIILHANVGKLNKSELKCRKTNLQRSRAWSTALG